MMQRNDRMPVRSTIVTEMPSTPRKYSMLKSLIHMCCSTRKKPFLGKFGIDCAVLNRTVATIDAIIARNEAMVEIGFAVFFGASTTSRAPMMGTQIVVD